MFQNVLMMHFSSLNSLISLVFTLLEIVVSPAPKLLAVVLVHSFTIMTYPCEVPWGPSFVKGAI